MCYYTAVPRFHMSEKKEDIQNAFVMSLYLVLPILPVGFVTQA